MQQGVIKKIELSLHTMSGFCNISIREKVKYLTLIILKEICLIHIKTNKPCFFLLFSRYTAMPGYQNTQSRKS